MLKAKLQLAQGTAFSGYAPSWQKDTIFYGEVVFNTAMAGYVQSLSDPSYQGQILVFTYPLIGNYNVDDPKKWQSDRIQAAGIVVSSLTSLSMDPLQRTQLLDWAQSQNIPILFDVDTRALTKFLRQQGVCLGAICSEDAKPDNFQDINQNHLVKAVSISEPKTLQTGAHKIILVDCGVKQSIIDHLSRFDITIEQVPYDYDFTTQAYDGVLISNGPGDPAQNPQTIAIIKKALSINKPIFGICLGAQMLALAAGATTYKLPFGHRGQNHPCQDTTSMRCYLTSQNHGYSIDAKTLPSDYSVSYTHLNDGSVQGIKHQTKPYSAVQFHPEAAPGPTDTEFLFDQFIQQVAHYADHATSPKPFARSLHEQDH